MSEMKRCSKCKTKYPATSEYFHKDKSQQDGLCCSCINCYKEYYTKNKDHILQRNKEYRIEYEEQCLQQKKEYYIKNKEYITQIKKEHYKENREHILQLAKENRVKNKEKISQKRKEYYIKNKEHITQAKKTYRVEHINEQLRYEKEYRVKNKEIIKQRRKEDQIKHKEHILQHGKEYRANHKERASQYEKEYQKTEKGKSVNSCARQKYRTLKKALPATLTVLQWEQIKLYFNNKCAYCGEEKPLTQEHFVALTKFGEYTQNNIIPACKNCNSSKRMTSFFTWFPQQKFYNKSRENKILKFLNYHERNQQLKLFIQEDYAEKQTNVSTKEG